MSPKQAQDGFKLALSWPDISPRWPRNFKSDAPTGGGTRARDAHVRQGHANSLIRLCYACVLHKLIAVHACRPKLPQKRPTEAQAAPE